MPNELKVSGSEVKWWSAGHKRAVVLHLLRGESVDAVARSVGADIPT